ncbi:MAG: hypothetical protein KGL39_57455 [Patescibacteria group bacterium]|nr:hypothetical protein [Patescibacteria group bacterium]
MPEMPNTNNGGAPSAVLPNPPAGRQSPFPPGTAEQILQWIAKLSTVIADLNKAQQAGLNMASYLMRANTAYQTLQRIYTTYYGQIPTHG